MNHLGTKPLETERLLLRRITAADAREMFENWASDPKVTEYLTWSPHTSLEKTKTLIARWEEEFQHDDCYRWCIECKANHQVIGTVDVVSWVAVDEAVIGYCLSYAYWRLGLMTEALHAVEDFLFLQVGVNRVEAYHRLENPASGRVMQKSGMRYVGVKEYREWDVDVYEMNRADWKANREREILPEHDTHLGAYAVIKRDEKLLLVKKMRGPYRGKLDLPGGTIEFGETPQQAVCREVLEETGLTAGGFKLLAGDAVCYPYEFEEELHVLHHIAFIYSIQCGDEEVRQTADGEDSGGAVWFDPQKNAFTNLTPFAEKAARGLWK